MGATHPWRARSLRVVRGDLCPPAPALDPQDAVMLDGTRGSPMAFLRNYGNLANQQVHQMKTSMIFRNFIAE